MKNNIDIYYMYLKCGDIFTKKKNKLKKIHQKLISVIAVNVNRYFEQKN